MKKNFHFSVLWSRTQRQSVCEVRLFRYREKFVSNDLVRQGPRTELNPRLRNGVRELATEPGCQANSMNFLKIPCFIWFAPPFMINSAASGARLPQQYINPSFLKFQ